MASLPVHDYQAHEAHESSVSPGSCPVIPWLPIATQSLTSFWQWMTSGIEWNGVFRDQTVLIIVILLFHD